jgi:hypothetical protein
MDVLTLNDHGQIVVDCGRQGEVMASGEGAEAMHTPFADASRVTSTMAHTF